MFTLKLYKRNDDHPQAVRFDKRIATRVLSVNNVESIQLTDTLIELRAFKAPQPAEYDTFYIGERTVEMTAINNDNHWGWGLLENAAGKTTEHYRPHNYG
jgi:hypothetical protein